MVWKMNEELKMLREDIDTLTNLLQKMSQVVIDQGDEVKSLERKLNHHETVWARIDNDVQLFGNKVVGYGLDKQNAE